MFFEQSKDSSVESDFARWDKKELSMDDVPTKETVFRLFFIVHKWHGVSRLDQQVYLSLSLVMVFIENRYERIFFCFNQSYHFYGK